MDSGDDLLILGPGDDGSTGDHFRVAEGEVSGDGGNDGLHGDSFADGIDSGNGEDTCDGGPHTDTAANCEKQISIP